MDNVFQSPFIYRQKYVDIPQPIDFVYSPFLVLCYENTVESTLCLECTNIVVEMAKVVYKSATGQILSRTLFCIYLV